MLITLIRTGGFTGIPLKKTIDTTKLKKEDRKKIEKLVIQSKQIFKYPNKQIEKSLSSPDRFTYTISLQDSAISQSVQLNEQSLTPEAQTLIGYLEKI